MLATVRKELRSVADGTTAHVFDRIVRNACVAELKANEGGEVAVRFCAIALNHRPALRGRFHRAGDVFIDLEGSDADVRADGHDELGGVVGQGVDRAQDDSGDRAPPSGMCSGDVPAWRMRNQDRHAIAGTRCDPETFDARG